DAAAEEVVLGAGAVLAAPLDVVGILSGARHRRDHHLVDLFRLHLQLPLHVDRRGRDEGVDAAAPGRLDGFAGAVDVGLAGAGKAADDGVLRALGDLAYGVEVAFRCDGEAGLDDVDAHLVEELGDFELLLMRHGGAGRLLAVAQRGVEYDDVILLGFIRGGGHWNVLLDSIAPAGREGSGSSVPLSAQAQTPSRPSGAGKQKEPANRTRACEGSGRSGRPGNRAMINARRHPKRALVRSASVAPKP